MARRHIREKIMDGVGDGPLGTHFLDSAKQEMAETACLVDLDHRRSFVRIELCPHRRMDYRL